MTKLYQNIFNWPNITTSYDDNHIFYVWLKYLEDKKLKYNNFLPSDNFICGIITDFNDQLYFNQQNNSISIAKTLFHDNMNKIFNVSSEELYFSINDAVKNIAHWNNNHDSKINKHTILFPCKRVTEPFHWTTGTIILDLVEKSAKISV